METCSSLEISGICLTNKFEYTPSLERGSVQLTRITKVKTDPAIPTVSISILIVKGLNADFDGKLHCRLIKFI